MKLEDVQQLFVAWLEAEPELGAAAVHVMASDGSYPALPEREAALAGTLPGKAKGLVLIVFEPKASDTVDTTATGQAAFDILVHVLVEENVSLNRGAGGSGISAEKACRLTMSALCGKRTFTNRNDTVRLYSVPFRHFGTVDGLRGIAANFDLRLFVG